RVRERFALGHRQLRPVGRGARQGACAGHRTAACERRCRRPRSFHGGVVATHQGHLKRLALSRSPGQYCARLDLEPRTSEGGLMDNAIVQTGEKRHRSLEAGRGLAWWSEAWALFMKNPVRWLLYGAIFLLGSFVLGLIPVLGGLALALLSQVVLG